MKRNDKKLALFDVDGTLCDTSAADDAAYRKALKDLYGLELSDEKWTGYKNQSTHNDVGSAKLILESELNAKNVDKELKKLKKHFLKLLEHEKNGFKEIPGARDFFNYLQSLSEYKIGIVTGSWKESGIIKLESIGIDVFSVPYGSADNYSLRNDIIIHVISEAGRQNNCAKFSKITYFGDGLWDLKAARDLGIDFVGVDFKSDGTLEANGAGKIINNYLDLFNVVYCLTN